MDPDANPFAVLSLIVAPAILTNASSVLVMSTSNRLARAVDRARELSKQLEAAPEARESERRLEELGATERRALLLVKGLGSFYSALGAFALATLFSLLGAVFAPSGFMAPVWILEVAGVLAGSIAVAALVYGSVLLVQDTRIAVQVLSDRADNVRAKSGAQDCDL
jgi:hypothetical protein